MHVLAAEGECILGTTPRHHCFGTTVCFVVPKISFNQKRALQHASYVNKASNVFCGAVTFFGDTVCTYRSIFKNFTCIQIYLESDFGFAILSFGALADHLTYWTLIAWYVEAGILFSYGWLTTVWRNLGNDQNFFPPLSRCYCLWRSLGWWDSTTINIYHSVIKSWELFVCPAWRV